MLLKCLNFCDNPRIFASNSKFQSVVDYDEQNKKEKTERQFFFFSKENGKKILLKIF